MRVLFVKKVRLGITFLFLFQLIIAVIGMVMIERMIPSQDKELKTIIEQQSSLQHLLAKSYTKSNFAETLQSENPPLALFELSLDKEWSDEQRLLLPKVREALMASSEVAPEDIRRTLQNLLKLQNERLTRKLDDLRLKGLAGSWTLAILTLLGRLGLYRFYVALRDRLLNPTQEIVLGLRDYQRGNRQRRFRSALKEGELHESIYILNDILDERPARH